MKITIRQFLKWLIKGQRQDKNTSEYRYKTDEIYYK